MELLTTGEIAKSVLDVLATHEELKSGVSSSKPVELEVDEMLLSSCRDLETSARTEMTEKQKNLYTRWNQERDVELQR